MTTLETPPATKRTGNPPSPSLKTDGISIHKKHLPRAEIVKEIYNTAKEQQFVVIGSPAATGKTSLLQLLGKALKEEKGANVLKINVSDVGLDAMLQRFHEKGIVDDEEKLQQLRNTWLLLDDAQNAYATRYAPLWQLVIKTISKADVDNNLFVVIAATYDLSTPESPVDFAAIAHINPKVSKPEARDLFLMHTEQWDFDGWGMYYDTLLRLSKFSESDYYHIGVVIAGIRVLNDKRKEPGRTGFNEEDALAALRSISFIEQLNRCFNLPSTMEPTYKDRLLYVVLGEKTSANFGYDATLAPLTRAGLLTKNGSFSCIAARWYYNHRCFPNRAARAPESLEELIKLAVGSISAKRLRDTLVNGFPKEAAFQHLFNEAMSIHLPIEHSIIPELNTFATDSNGNPVQGELDFYVNGDKQWCLELLRNGDKIGEHVARFDACNGKYRKVAMKDYLVVDCRGPKKGVGARIEEPRCTLYFSDDFKKCLCQMRCKEPIEIVLQD